MQWIYLFIFVLILIVLQVILRDFHLTAEKNLESLIIFLLGLLGFLLFRWQDQLFRHSVKERQHYQKEANIVSRDLVGLYSYIGETNRKLELLKNIALHLPDTKLLFSGKKQRLYHSITEAIALLGKTKSFTVLFIEHRTGAVTHTLQYGRHRLPDAIEGKRLLEDDFTLLDPNRYLVIRAPKTLSGCSAFLILTLRQARVEDVETLKVLTHQALFFYVLEKSVLSRKESGLTSGPLGKVIE